jgi:predicted ATPase
MLERQIKQEKDFDENPPILDLIFCDRCCIDVLAYFEYYVGDAPKEMINQIKKLKYGKVFILDRLKLKNDGTRIEKDDEEAEKIHNKIIETYERLGYEVIKVPIMEVERRTSFILKNIFN